MVAGFGPGFFKWQARPGVAKRIPAGSTMYMQVHYTPNGIEATDLSRVGLKFTDTELVEKELLSDGAMNCSFRIPANTDNFLVTADYTFQHDMQLVSIGPHMHLRGKAFRFDSIDSSGKLTLLLNVPRFDFGFQASYVFNHPVLMRAGSKLHCSAWFDNSSNNPSNPDPTKTVSVGLQTWDEMLVGQFEAFRDGQDLHRESFKDSSGE
jgi:hypothetical protein